MKACPLVIRTLFFLEEVLSLNLDLGVYAFSPLGP
jgi:hypothetical protein